MTAPVSEEVICRTPENETVGWNSGAYYCVRMTGQYNDEFAGSIRTQVLTRQDPLALEASGLRNIPMHFARELYFAARDRKEGHHRIILINPPDYLRSLLKLISDNHGIPIVSDFHQLPPDPGGIETQVRKLEDSVNRIRENLQNNPLWQFSDREGFWVCPYCACPLTNARISSRINIPRNILDQIHSHVTIKCPNYDPRRPSMLTKAQMGEAVQKINSEKYAMSRERTQELQSKVSKLEERSRWADEMEKGLKVAVERQKHLLPPAAPTMDKVETALVYRPAAQISGDFYDFIELEEGVLAVILGDVSGHGIEAGILMGMTKKVLQIRVGEIADLRQAVLRANIDICRELGKTSFVTAFIAVIDVKKKKFTYVRAGHNPTLIINPKRKEKVLELEMEGTILGMSSGPAVEKSMGIEEVDLESGDHIIFYTDGLEEARNPQEEMFGRERIKEVVQREIGKPLGYILGALSYELDTFSAGVPQEDDVTVIGLRLE